ncbi:hypothetical protein ACK8GG_00700 [Micromonosporaceae bacterium DT55]|uniref:WXG100-like domain-containing protein n=1 Tax=Melissospora conviva TaxID=3388432 RepID=UPI003C1EC47D
MGLQLPGELTSLLDILGYTWPQADETRLFELGQAWIGFAGTIDSVVAEAGSGAATVWTGNEGSDIQAFRSWWSAPDSPAATLADGATAALLTGSGLIICATIVLSLKIAVIAQLVVLAIQIAQAVAASVATFGASLSLIPVFHQICRTIVGLLIEEVLWMLLDG